MSQYWLEFVTLASVHLIAVASPGPDFAVVVKNSIRHGRSVALATSIGIGVGILLHVSYSLLGISLLIKTTPWVYSAFSYCAAAYLAWLALGALRSKPQPSQMPDTQNDKEQTYIPLSLSKGFWMGFLTNGLNPKATLFFMSVFTVVISINTPMHIQIVYGVYLSLATGAWFCFLSYLLSTSKVASFIGSKGYWLDRMMGVMLLLLAVNLLIYEPV